MNTTTDDDYVFLKRAEKMESEAEVEVPKYRGYPGGGLGGNPGEGKLPDGGRVSLDLVFPQRVFPGYKSCPCGSCYAPPDYFYCCACGANDQMPEVLKYKVDV